MSPQRDRDTDSGVSADRPSSGPGSADGDPTPEALGSRDGTARSAPRVSVIIPAYNVAPYIAEALASVSAQRFSAYETVLVNDGSSDSEALEREIAPHRSEIVYIKQPNKGAAAARNAAIRAARGDLVAFLDGDDVWMPDFLDSQVAYLETTGYDMVYSDALLFGEGIQERRTYMTTSPSRGPVTPQSLIEMRCNVITSGTVLRRECIVSAGFFDESPQWRRGQDFEMWFRLAKRGAKIGYQERVLLKYRVRPENLSGNDLDRSIRDLWSLLGIRAKFQFTPSEQAALDHQIAEAAAVCQVEMGKTQIVNGQLDAARTNFAAANRQLRRLKLWVVCCLLKVAPGAVQHLLRRRVDREADVTRGSKLTPTVDPTP